jgi:DNA invertase Pin-like site-specific DNA recombinase
LITWGRFYYRVSTRRQGNSGVRLDVQKAGVRSWLDGGNLLAEHTEVETGKNDANRPALATALRDCKLRKATLACGESPGGGSRLRP